MIKKTKKISLFIISLILIFSILNPFLTYSTSSTSINEKNNVETTSSEDFPLDHRYIIISNENLNQNIRAFEEWKTKHGYTVQITNISWISNHYTGRDLAEKIRTFLKTIYTSQNETYVLLIGSHESIPMRYCYPNNYYEGSPTVPTDYYYADLTGDWDADNDGYYGELHDNPDFTPEVHVGRIPFDNADTVNQFLAKTMSFQNTTHSWKKNALLLGSFLWLNNYKGHNDTQTDGAVLNEKLWNELLSQKNFSHTTMYEKEGYAQSIYPCDFSLNNSNLRSIWPTGYGIINWVGHGKTQSFQRLIWTKDNGDGIPYTGNDTINHVSLFSNQNDTNGNDVLYLNDKKPSIVFSTGCDNANIDNYKKSLAESLLENGATVFIGATRDLYGPFNWTTQKDGGIETINYLFFTSFIKNVYSTGVSLDLAKTKYYQKYMDIGKIWWNYQNLYSLNIFGDPSLYIQESPDPPIITGPSSIKKGKNTSFEFTITDPQQDKIYLKIDWGDNEITEWKGPFESNKTLTLSHQWNEKNKKVTLKAKAKDEYGWESNWTTYSLTIKKTLSIGFYKELFDLFDINKRFFPILRFVSNLIKD